MFLLYACYQPLRFSIEDPERQARYAAVFAIVAGAFVPLNFLAVRLAQSLAHPRVLERDRRQPARARCALTFLVALLGDGAAVRDAVEVRAGVQARRDAAARAPAPAGRRRRPLAPPAALGGAAAALMPALPLDEAGKYVAAAYLVFLALILIYVAIMARRLVADRARGRRADELADAPGAEARPPTRARGGRRDERAARARRLAQDRAARAARADRADRRAAPSALLAELRAEPAIHEAVVVSTCNRTELYLVAATRWRRRPWSLGKLARRAGMRPTELLEGVYSRAQLRRRAPPLPRRQRAGLDGRRRGRGPGPGQARLRARARRPHDRAADQQAVPRGARRPASACARRPRSARAAQSVASVAVELAQDALGELATATC